MSRVDVCLASWFNNTDKVWEALTKNGLQMHSATINCICTFRENAKLYFAVYKTLL